MNVSIILYNNKYYVFKLIYYTYSSVKYLQDNIGYIGGEIYQYFNAKRNNNMLEDVDPVLDYVKPLPSAPPMSLLSNHHQPIVEYVMVEKNDLMCLLHESGNVEMHNKYINLQR